MARDVRSAPTLRASPGVEQPTRKRNAFCRISAAQRADPSTVQPVRPAHRRGTRRAYASRTSSGPCVCPTPPREHHPTGGDTAHLADQRFHRRVDVVHEHGRGEHHVELVVGERNVSPSIFSTSTPSPTFTCEVDHVPEMSTPTRRAGSRRRSTSRFPPGPRPTSLSTSDWQSAVVGASARQTCRASSVERLMITGQHAWQVPFTDMPCDGAPILFGVVTQIQISHVVPPRNQCVGSIIIIHAAQEC